MNSHAELLRGIADACKECGILPKSTVYLIAGADELDRLSARVAELEAVLKRVDDLITAGSRIEHVAGTALEIKRVVRGVLKGANE